MNKIRIPIFVCLVSAVLFSLTTLSFSFDISLISFPVSILFSVISAYFLFFKTLQKKEFFSAKVSRKLLQYICFVFLAAFIIRRAGANGTPYWLDVISVFFWCVTFVSSLIILHFFKEKRIYSLESEWKNQKSAKGKIIGSVKISAKSVLKEIVDWIDALVQAIFMVLLIQIFIFQLYVIPSESMVPYFLIGDRVFVFKTLSGPKFPLSDVGLPEFKKYKRGDVVVFRNPHYSLDRKSEVKTVVSQILYMLTLTAVNINVDENGELKADPLVKRLCGLPGEQLVLQDGVLYAKTKENPEFTPVDYDATRAYWSLNELPENVKQKIKYIPLSKKDYEDMILIENERNALNLEDAAIECKSIVQNYKRLGVKLADCSELFNIANYLIYSQENFSNFMTDWINQKDESVKKIADDPYKMANFKLNLMIKLNVGRYVLRKCQMAKLNQEHLFLTDEKIKEYNKMSELLYKYIQILDQRNMPVFPANDENGNAQFIPEDCYFMMGDNRFNSLDMRHSYEQKLVPLTEFDEYSISYYSNMEPQYVNKKYILGTTSFRILPVNRAGLLK